MKYNERRRILSAEDKKRENIIRYADSLYDRNKRGFRWNQEAKKNG